MVASQFVNALPIVLTRAGGALVNVDIAERAFPASNAPTAIVVHQINAGGSVTTVVHHAVVNVAAAVAGCEPYFAVASK